MDRAGIAEVGALLRDDAGRRDALILGGRRPRRRGGRRRRRRAHPAVAQRRGRPARRALPGPERAAAPAARVAGQGAAVQLLGDLVRAMPGGDASPRLLHSSNTPPSASKLSASASIMATKIREFSQTYQNQLSGADRRRSALDLMRKLGNRSGGAALHGGPGPPAAAIASASWAPLRAAELRQGSGKLVALKCRVLRRKTLTAKQ